MDKKNKHLVKLGQQIRQARKAKDLSQEALALLADIDRSYMGGIERGERNVSFLTLVKLATYLDCSVSTFTMNIPDPEEHKTE